MPYWIPWSECTTATPAAYAATTPSGAPGLWRVRRHRPTGALTKRGVEFFQRRGAGNELFFAELVEWRIDRVERRVHVHGLGVEVEQPRDDLSLGMPLLQIVHAAD